MTDPVTTVLVGIGGYGEVYLDALLEEPWGDACRIVGAVDPNPETCSRLETLREMGVSLFPSLEAFYEGGTADLAVLSSPIQLHAPHTCLALAKGSHVLVEKPAAVTTADVDQMVKARNRAMRFVAVGFQWSFSDSILALKREILDGRFGAPLWGRSLTLWPRTETYYQRNDWAGRKRDDRGRWILDSPASNAMAHHLHNLLFLLGPEVDRSTDVLAMDARLARVNRIETFDSIGARIGTSSGAEILFLASHSIPLDEAADPRFTVAFERGLLTYPGGPAPVTFRFHQGGTRAYPAPDTTSQVKKLRICVDACSRTSPDPWRVLIPCGLEASRPHAAVVEALERSGVEPVTFAADGVRTQETEGECLRYVPGLAAALRSSYASGTLPEFPGGIS